MIMATQTTFQMRVADVFHLSDGRTVFVGEILGSASRIGKTKCQLLVDDVVRDYIEIEGEILFTTNKTNHRAVSVDKAVSITSDDVKEHEYVLEPLED